MIDEIFVPYYYPSVGVRVTQMLNDPQFTQSSFSIFMSRNTRILDRVNELSAALKSTYFDPEAVAITSDASPEFPRLRFQSQHGFSQILVSEISIILNIRYSLDWQKDLPRAHNYLEDRSSLAFDLAEIVGSTPFFCGMTTEAAISSQSRSEDFLPRLADFYGLHFNTDNPHDVVVKITSVLKDQYFLNVTVQNYRSWSLAPFQQGILRFSNANAVERGVQITVDFNDRYAFNENPNYLTTQDARKTVIAIGLEELTSVVERLRSAKW